MLISPTEPAQIRALGVTSPIPEEFGSDVFFGSKLGLVGIQRKECKDLIASTRDGRLAKELAQMKRLSVPVVMIEGNWQWTTEGESLRVVGTSRRQVRGLVFSLLSQGCWTIETSNMDDTCESMLLLRNWCDKTTHNSLQTRPKAPASGWGTRTNRDWGVHLLQSFPGVGLEMAERIYDEFGGVPMKWNVDAERLMQVPGVGKKRAQGMMKALE